MKSQLDIPKYFKEFTLRDTQACLPIFSLQNKTLSEDVLINGSNYPKYINEYWTPKQRQASSVHEISYRACFKPQLPRFFIELFTKDGDIVYDPFNGRGTTIIEAGLHGRNVIGNDINPLSEILSFPRFFIPNIEQIAERLDTIPSKKKTKKEIDLSMFYHLDTEKEILSLREYLAERSKDKLEDFIDKWIRMVATNRLTGHSSGFFSVYTLPPNQAVSPESQIKINKKMNQKPEYRNIKEIILKKSKSLIRDISGEQKSILRKVGEKALFLNNNAGLVPEIKTNSVQLTVTSPPFLDIVQYSKDNWLRCWFNCIDDVEVSKKITMSKTIEEWSSAMMSVFRELYRITKIGGWVAFEVGEIRKGKLNLEDYVIPLGLEVGFECEGVLVNKQEFTKTSNIWGISNNNGGTNTNRIVLFHKL